VNNSSNKVTKQNKQLNFSSPSMFLILSRPCPIHAHFVTTHYHMLATETEGKKYDRTNIPCGSVFGAVYQQTNCSMS
jgi:hypothetical protein